MENQKLDPGLPLIQQASLAGKTVLVRFDHNVVKDGEIKDPYRIDRTFRHALQHCGARREADTNDPCWKAEG